MTEELQNLGNLLTGRPLVSFVLAYAVFPYLALWLAVRCWPPDDPRRSEYLSEYDHVPWHHRPLWVADVAVRCVLDGCALRNKGWRTRRTIRLAATQPVRTRPSWIWFTAPRAGPMLPFCTFLGIPEMIAAASWNMHGWLILAVGYFTGAATLHGLYRLVYARRTFVWRRARTRLAFRDDPVSGRAHPRS